MRDKIEILSGAENFEDLTFLQVGDEVRISFSNFMFLLEDQFQEDFTAADFTFG